MRDGTTKQKIFEAASEMFAKDGYGEVSMRDIAAAVGVTEGAIYRHYENKASILKAILNEASRKIEISASALRKECVDTNIETDSPRQALERCIFKIGKEHLKFLSESLSVIIREHAVEDLANELVMYRLDAKVSESIRYVLDKLVERGSIPPLDTEIVSLLWTRSILGTSVVWASRVYSEASPETSAVRYRTINNYFVEAILNGKLL